MPIVAPSTGGVVIAAVAIAIGGVLAAVGSVLPWIRLGTDSASGMDGDGWITLVLGVGLIIVGLAGATNARRAARVRALAALGGLAVLGIALYEIANLPVGSGTIPDGSVEPIVGEGLYVVLAGGIVALAGALGSRGRR